MTGANSRLEMIQSKLSSIFAPLHLEVTNESDQHNVPVGSETHFRVVIVSQKFTGLSRLARQRLVNEALAVEMKTGVHALTQRCLTSEEWQNTQGSGFVSPPCHGGSKADR
jgi:BolA protein